jgi:glycosyltransferase involved in cell wall biosynthesis
MNKNENMPLVSVGIVTYNQKHFLRECIESVLDQDYPHVEIVVADDASTDSTPEMLLDYAQKYPGKFVLRLGKTNVGVTKNSNEAFFACSGKYIAWMGGDDLMLPGKISAQVAWLEENPERVICGHKLHLCDETSRVYGIHSKRLMSGVGPGLWISDGCLYGACSIMMRKDHIPQYGFDERIKIASDWKMWIDSLKDNSVYGYLDKAYGI